jgi:hypothetical protein
MAALTVRLLPVVQQPRYAAEFGVELGDLPCSQQPRGLPHTESGCTDQQSGTLGAWRLCVALAYREGCE